MKTSYSVSLYNGARCVGVSRFDNWDQANTLIQDWSSKGEPYSAKMKVETIGQDERIETIPCGNYLTQS